MLHRSSIGRPACKSSTEQATISGVDCRSYGAGSRSCSLWMICKILQTAGRIIRSDSLQWRISGRLKWSASWLLRIVWIRSDERSHSFSTIKPSIEPYTAVTLSTVNLGHPSNGMEWWGSDHGNHQTMQSFLPIGKSVSREDLVLGGMYRTNPSYTAAAVQKITG
ncbi:MAG: hypothetical protein U0T81_03780 [Saprospiraceae bacterium]